MFSTGPSSPCGGKGNRLTPLSSAPLFSLMGVWMPSIYDNSLLSLGNIPGNRKAGYVGSFSCLVGRLGVSPSQRHHVPMVCLPTWCSPELQGKGWPHAPEG